MAYFRRNCTRLLAYHEVFVVKRIKIKLSFKPTDNNSNRWNYKYHRSSLWMLVGHIIKHVMDQNRTMHEDN